MTPADHANEEPRLMFCVCDDTPCSCGAFYSQPTPADHANKPDESAAPGVAATPKISGAFPEGNDGEPGAADHANTVREALPKPAPRAQVDDGRVEYVYTDNLYKDGLVRAAHAALDALQTQAETAAERETGKAYDRGFANGIEENRRNREAAEAERDQALKDAADYLNHLHRAEAERDHARDALRRIADWPVAVHVDPASDVRLIRREARAALGDKP